MSELYEKATPRPWVLDGLDICARDGNNLHVLANTAVPIGVEQWANAALIVHAVNNIERLEQQNAKLREALKGFISWAKQKCPCENEKPNPCTLCGVSVESLEGCKAVDATLPRDLLTVARAALQEGTEP